ncbi:MgtC/SapB family protein [Aminobacter sp. Piv2-1]|uniref:MgtC/SapB family protein n=1 Tax=Aminobacter sp. Piv2-1 TaxID=3031122 RepID=UPI0030A026E8
MDAIIARLGLALAIGLLVGLERGWQERNAPEGSRTAGIRTYGVSGLLGGVLAELAMALSASSILIAGFLGFAAVFSWFKAREAIHDDDFSVTSVMAGLAVFGLGALAVAGDYRAAAAGGAALAALLASRELLHGLLRRLTWVELRSALILAVMTTIVLPLLPDRAIDPWQGFNPREVWIFTVLIAAISYLGYVAVRVLGPARGLLVSAVAGAVVSSTAVTVALARAAKSSESVWAMAGAASFAAAVSVVRVLAIALLVQPAVAAVVALPVLAAAAGFVASGVLLFSIPGAKQLPEAAMRNPFELGPLLVFAGFFAAVSVASAILAGFFGDAGMIAASAVSGLFDVDVAVLSALRRVAESSVGASALAVLVALAANAAGRFALAAMAGPLRFSAAFMAATVTALALGAAAFAMSPIE